MTPSIFNPQLMAIARDRRAAELAKVGFVDPAAASGAAPPGGDPMAAAGGAMPPGGDPMAAMGGGAPPGGDPMAAAGGAMPPGAGGITRPEVEALIQTAVGAGGGAGGEPAKKKVDVNTEIYQIKKMLAMLLDAQGIPVPATMTLGDPAEDPKADPNAAVQDPASAGFSPGSAISAIGGIPGASPAGAQADAQKKAAGYAQGRPAPAGPALLAMRDRADALRRVLREATNAN